MTSWFLRDVYLMAQGGGVVLQDLFHARNEQHNDDYFLEWETKKIAWELIKKSLTPREFKVVAMRFGLSIDENETLSFHDEVFSESDLNKKRLDQIKRHCLFPSLFDLDEDCKKIIVLAINPHTNKPFEKHDSGSNPLLIGEYVAEGSTVFNHDKKKSCKNKKAKTTLTKPVTTNLNVKLTEEEMECFFRWKKERYEQQARRSEHD